MFWLLKIISNLWFLLIGIFPFNYNIKKVNFSKSYIITPNHQSFLDAAIIYTSIPHLFKTLGKKEIEKAPFYGVIYKAVVITVDRSSLAARATSFRKMKTELEKGNSIAIFPEGTFSDTPLPNLLPFQDGCFSLAILQQVDILPVLFIDASKRLHPSKLIRFSPGLNRTIYLPPISCTGLEKKDMEALKNYTQQYMQACLNYCRINNKKSVWQFALNWQNENSISLK
jgi:1-acyl-sn-glycerol-3-phosphate acyltransferase